MVFSDKVLRNDEKVTYRLRELYGKFGYSQFKVGRFEEYDLYARNKSFLVSENILTFTDTNGKLMALKPDVTLSIIKNISDDNNIVHKFYYNENVYRPSAESHGFKEIMQTGLECVGNIDLYSESEVLFLAAKSLESISSDCILDISHMGLIEGFMDSADILDSDKIKLLGYIKSKNMSAIKSYCESGALSEMACEVLCHLVQMYLPLEEALSFIGSCIVNERMKNAYEELCDISDIMKSYGLSARINFDFSVVNDRNYYDGIIFKGFVNGVPDSVISGGRYDRLLSKMGKKCGAVGFAVYLDRLERFGNDGSDYDVDVMLIYDSDVDCKSIIDTVKLFNQNGKTVKTMATVDTSVRYRQLLKIGKGGIEILETND